MPNTPGSWKQARLGSPTLLVDMLTRVVEGYIITVQTSMRANIDLRAAKLKSMQAKKKLVDACYKYLKDHDGVLYFSAGVRAEDVKEKVSAADWDVGLHIVFKDKAALAKYGPHPAHQKFIAENKENWKGVKVYDSLIDSSRK